MSDEAFNAYRSTDVLEMRPLIIGESLQHIYVSPAYSAAGSPKPGDMVARNPKKPEDQWLVTAEYFRENFEPLTDAKPMDDVEPAGPTALDVVAPLMGGLVSCFSVEELRLAVEHVAENEKGWERLAQIQRDFAEHLPFDVSDAPKKPHEH